MKNKVYILVLFAMFLGCVLESSYVEPEQLAIIVEKNIYGKLGDSIPISVSLSYPSKNVQYIWTIDGVSMDDTTYDTTRIVQWFAPDTFVHSVIISGIGRYDQIAPAETAFVKLSYSVPQVVLDGPSRLFTNDTAVFVASGLDSDGVIEKYLWSVEPKNVSWFTTDSILKYVWDKNDYGVRIVRVCAVDNSGLKSSVDSVAVKVLGSGPVVNLNVSDTLIYTNRELKIWAGAYDTGGYISKYEWAIDGEIVDTAKGDTVILKWDVSRDLPYQVTVTVTDNDSVQVFDTVFVTVESAELYLTAMDTAVYTGDTQTFVVRSIPESKADEYLWVVDGVEQKCGDTLHKIWSTEKIGERTIIVSDVNDSYTPDTMISQVNDGRPKIVPLNDTVVSSGDTLVLQFVSSDVNGTVEKYLWGTFGKEWTDSSDTPEAKIVYGGSKELVLVWGARDNSKSISMDTVIIRFNRVPEVSVIAPSVDDTIWLSEKNNSDIVEFKFTLTDVDGDFLSTSVSCGMNADDLKPVKPDINGMYVFLVDNKGMYYWNVVTNDSFGNKVSASGKFVAVLKHTICFAGHSIVAGMGGDEYHGGFRKYVLDGLRESCGEFEAIKAVGPLVTSYMSGEDDSCFAYPKSIAEQMEILMKECPDLTADMWVWMMGTNSLETSAKLRNEVKYFTLLLEESYRRNEDASIYLVNCIPFADGSDLSSSNSRLTRFNDSLSNKIDTLKDNGYNIYGIDAYTLWLDEDSLQDASLFFDSVHPNQVGYEKLGNEILRVIRESK